MSIDVTTHLFKNVNVNLDKFIDFILSPLEQTMTSPLPERINGELARMAVEMTGEHNSKALTNVRLILQVLRDSHPSPSWVIRDLVLSIAEDDCIVLQWARKNLFCHVYPDLVALDGTTTLVSLDTVTHYEKELAPEAITENFYDCFMNILLSSETIYNKLTKENEKAYEALDKAFFES